MSQQTGAALLCAISILRDFTAMRGSQTVDSQYYRWFRSTISWWLKCLYFQSSAIRTPSKKGVIGDTFRTGNVNRIEDVDLDERFNRCVLRKICFWKSTLEDVNGQLNLPLISKVSIYCVRKNHRHYETWVCANSTVVVTLGLEQSDRLTKESVNLILRN